MPHLHICKISFIKSPWTTPGWVCPQCPAGILTDTGFRICILLIPFYFLNCFILPPFFGFFLLLMDDSCFSCEFKLDSLFFYANFNLSVISVITSILRLLWLYVYRNIWVLPIYTLNWLQCSHLLPSIPNSSWLWGWCPDWHECPHL